MPNGILHNGELWKVGTYHCPAPLKTEAILTLEQATGSISRMQTTLPSQSSPKSTVHGKILRVANGSMHVGTTALSRPFIGSTDTFSRMRS
jgi:hypothetical protein